MRQLVKFLVLLALLLSVVAATAYAQIGIGTATPNSKAALDIQAADKGLLVPRLTAAQRAAIASPPQGLMVYQTDGSPDGGAQTGFWYYAGSPAQWVFLNPAPGAASLTLPYAGTGNTAGAAFSITNSGNGQAVGGTTTGAGTGVIGSSTGTGGAGVVGTTVTGEGVSGFASGSGKGLSGYSVAGTSLFAGKFNPADRGRTAEFTNSSAANDSTAVLISSLGRQPALRVVSTASSAQAAIRGVKQGGSVNGAGLEGVAASGTSGDVAGVRGLDRSGSIAGSGVYGSSTGGNGVYGESNAPFSSGNAAVAGYNGNSAGTGVRGIASGGLGVSGYVFGAGTGVSGEANSGDGVAGASTSGVGVRGSSSSEVGVVGITLTGAAGVRGSNANANGAGVLGTTASGTGVRGESATDNGKGVYGVAFGGNGAGVEGSGQSTSVGIMGTTVGTRSAGFFSQFNTTSSAPAVEIEQRGTGPALRIGSAGRPAEINGSTTGSANLVPIAYGYVNANGTIASGTGNFTVSFDNTGVGFYQITLTGSGAGLDLSTALCMASGRSSTANGGLTVATAYGSSAGRIGVLTASASNNQQLPRDFCFIVYRP